MSSPDLFVVCKSCQAEVSPYVTECPYCGNRLRKRAPKIEREGAEAKPLEPPKPKRFKRRSEPGVQTRRRPAPKPSAPRLDKLRSSEIPGIRGDEFGRPHATFLLIFLIMGVWLSLAFTIKSDLALTAVGGDPWRYATAMLLNDGLAAQMAAVIGVGLFGWLLERRHGAVPMVAIFLLCGPAALAAATALDTDALVFGTHGAALGLLCAWLVPVLLYRRKFGDDSDDADLLGVAVVAATLLLIPLVSQGSLVAGLVGGGAGLLCGLALAALKPRT